MHRVATHGLELRHALLRRLRLASSPTGRWAAAYRGRGRPPSIPRRHVASHLCTVCRLAAAAAAAAAVVVVVVVAHDDAAPPCARHTSRYAAGARATTTQPASQVPIGARRGCTSTAHVGHRIGRHVGRCLERCLACALPSGRGAAVASEAAIEIVGIS